MTAAALLAALGCFLASLSNYPPAPDETALAAARIALGHLRVLKDLGLASGHPIDPVLDPAESGLIGVITPI